MAARIAYEMLFVISAVWLDLDFAHSSIDMHVDW
jgi:hypothetical protein